MEGGVCGGRAAIAAQRVQGWAPSPGSRLCKALDSVTGKGGLILLVEELHFVACGPEEGKSENVSVSSLPTALTLSVGEKD